MCMHTACVSFTDDIQAKMSKKSEDTLRVTSESEDVLNKDRSSI